MIHIGDCVSVLRTLASDSIDSVVTDPPYHLTNGNGSTGFMGKKWDGGDVAFRPETWAAVLRVMKPGAHLLAFGGTRTYHRMVCAIEDAGFEIRDQIAWVYGSGFPKSHDVSKGIDRMAGAEREVIGRHIQSKQTRKLGNSLKGSEDGSLAWQHDITAPTTDAARQWQGWGSALKPALEPIVVARKPLTGTIAANVLRWGTGALNIDGCRVASGDENPSIARRNGSVAHLSDRPARETEAEGRIVSRTSPERYTEARAGETLGRWPANLIHDGSEEVLAGFPDRACGMSIGHNRDAADKPGGYDGGWRKDTRDVGYSDEGSAARFFYCAKANKKDRGEGNLHPTIKPTELMRYLVRLITPPGGTVLDLFCGSGSTGKAAVLEDFDFVGIDIDEDHVRISEARMAAARVTKIRENLGLLDANAAKLI